MKACTAAFVMIMSLIHGSSAFAQSRSGTKLTSIGNTHRAVIPARPPQKPYLINGFQVSFEYMTPLSSESDVKSKVTGNVQRGLKGDLDLAPKSLGLRFGYKQIHKSRMGFDLGLSALKSDRKQQGESDIITFLPSANFILATENLFYGAAGVNTSLETGDSNAKHYPRLGFQVGAGFIFKKNFNVEVFHNWINQGLESQYALIEERTTSTNARLTYLF